MQEILAFLTVQNVAVAVAVFAVVVFVMVLAFGREHAWEALKAVWRRFGGGGGAKVLMALTVMGALGGCAAFPRTTAAFNEGGVAPAIDTFLTQAITRVVAVCAIANGPKLSTIVDLAALASDQTERIAEIRADRKLWCDALGGSLMVDVQDAGSEG